MNSGEKPDPSLASGPGPTPSESGSPPPGPAPRSSGALSIDSSGDPNSLASPGLVALGVGVALAVAFVYWNTSAPGAWWGDGLEFAAAARWLGVPHPPGYPLYMILGHAAIRLTPWWEAGRTLTLFSSACSLISAALMGAIVYEALAPAGRSEPDSAARRTRSMLAGGAFVAVAFTRTLWDHATFTEVYPLALALTSAIVLLSAKMLRGPSSRAQVFLMGILWGFAALHHYSIVAVAPVAGLAILVSAVKRKSAFVDIALFFTVVAVMSLGYGYIPMRAAQNPPLNWGDAQSFEQVIWMLKGGSYGGFFLQRDDLLSGHWGEGWRTWTGWWGRQILPLAWHKAAAPLGTLLALASTAGCLIHSWRRRSLFGVGLVLSLLVTLVFGVLYRILDIDGYFLPALPAATVGLAEIWGLFITAARRLGASPVMKAILGLVPLGLGCALLSGHYREIDKSWDNGPELWADSVLEAMPENALLITEDRSDSEVFALWYAQMVQGKRPDVTVFAAGFIFSGWYERYFESFDRPQLPLFVTKRPPGWKDEFDVALIAGVMVPNLKQRRVFTTYTDPALTHFVNPVPRADTLDEDYYTKTAYKIFPPGRILFELSRNRELEPDLNARFLGLFGEEPPLASLD